MKKYVKDDFSENDVIIISALNYDKINEMLINCRNVSSDIYIKDFERLNSINPNPIKILNKCLKENKKCLLLNNYLEYDNLIINFLELFNVEIIDKYNFDCNSLYNNIIDKSQNIIILINEFDDIKRVKILDELKFLGFSLENENIVSLQPIKYSKKFFLKENIEINDCLCGHAHRYDSVNSCGWKIIGKEKNNSPKIVILGGSTSTEEFFYPETWMRKLYKKLNALNLNCVFYIGASGSYEIIHELFRFLRDGHIIKPDIVISMSGVNDTYEIKLNSRFNLQTIEPKGEYVSGIPSNEGFYDYWLRIEKMFKLYVDSLNAQFFSFLQPMNLWHLDATVESKMTTEDEIYINGNMDFLKNANDNDIYTNLLGLFHNQPEMFIDECHYSDKGAEILSDKVLEKIMPVVSKIKK